MTAPLLRESGLQASTAIAATMMEEIQALVSSSWNIDTDLGGGTLSGTPNDLDYEYSTEYSDSGTIVPGIPALTVTPEYVIPAVVVPPQPGCCTVNWCSPWSRCTSEIPGTPAITTTPAITVAAVITPEIPPLTGGYSTELRISASVVGISDALEPLFSSITFKNEDISDPDSNGLANQTVTYNLDQAFAGTALQISGSAGFYDLSVDVAGVTTNFGNLTTGTVGASNIPNIPIEFDATIVIPSFNDSSEIINNVDGVAYSLFPQTNDVSVDNMEISSGVTALADFIENPILSSLTSVWNSTVVPLYTAVGASAPTAPSQTLSNEISNSAAGLQQTINQGAEQGVDSLLDSNLSTIQPYVQALTAAVWDYSTYPIVPGGNYAGAIMVGGQFSGADASNSSFKNSNLSGADFSDANVNGSDFTGANLSGTNFSGATGAPSSRRSARSAETTFRNAVAFDADFEGTDFDLSKAYVDSKTKLPKGQAGKLFATATFVASNRKLLKNYGLNYQSAKGHFIADTTCKGNSNKQGIRTDVSKGDLNLTGFDHQQYIAQLSERVQDRMTSYDGRHSLAEVAAIHKIASNQPWSDHDSAEYLAANQKRMERLIERLGSTGEALDRGQRNFLNNGIFRDRPLKLGRDAMHRYIENYPQVVGETGGSIDAASLSYHYVTIGHDQGQSI